MIGTIVRFIVSALVLMLVSWITPGIEVAGFWGALLASLIIAGLGWVAMSMLGKGASPTSRGFTAFAVAALIIWLTGALFPQLLNVTWWGAALAAFVIGLVDSVVPTALR